MKYIFGPVPSRRLGFSLGVDVIPHKTCSFNCVYCECGNTTNLTLERREYIPLKLVVNELKEFLSTYKGKIDYITLSGSGEPLLYSKLFELTKSIKGFTNIPLALLTNGSLLTKKSVRKELCLFDVVLPSLDTASQKTFLKINRPYKSLKIGKIIQGLIKFRKEFKGKIYLEVLLVKDLNDSIKDILKLKEAIRKIKPEKVQLNTVCRPPAETSSEPLRLEQLNEIKNILGRNVEIIKNFDSKISQISPLKIKRSIYSLLRRRPCTIKDLSLTLGIKKQEIEKYIYLFINKKIVKEVLHNKNKYYILKRKDYAS